VTTFLRTDEGDLAIPRVIVTDPGQCARQQAIDILALWASEWFLDQSIGFPWQSLLGLKIVNTTQIEALLKQAILSVTGVTSVTAQVQFNRTQRAFSYNFSATLNTGAILTGGSNQPFRVSNQETN
jgi:hypothetical protein